RAQPRKTGFAAKLRVEPGVVGDVVAVRAALARLHEGGGVEMRDAERLQIGHDLGGLLEVEIRGQLQAIGGDRNGGRHDQPPLRQNTDQGSRCSLASPPQIGVPGVCGAWRAMSADDRLALRSSVAPSPKRQLAVSRPSSWAFASPKVAP